MVLDPAAHGAVEDGNRTHYPMKCHSATILKCSYAAKTFLVQDYQPVKGERLIPPPRGGKGWKGDLRHRYTAATGRRGLIQ